MIAARRGSYVRMWEARCEPGRTDEAVAWVQQRVAPDALEAGAHTAEVFRSEALRHPASPSPMPPLYQ